MYNVSGLFLKFTHSKGFFLCSEQQQQQQQQEPLKYEINYLIEHIKCVISTKRVHYCSLRYFHRENHHLSVQYQHHSFVAQLNGTFTPSISDA